MDSIISYFSSMGLDVLGLSKFAVILFLGALLLCAVCRFIFRKQTLLSSAISSSIAIIYIYVAMVLILTMAEDLRFLVTPLPFVSISQESIHFFRFEGADYTVIAAQVLSMIILAFLVNLVDQWLPKSKNLLKWLFWRCLTVAIGFFLHYLFSTLFNRFLPQVIVLYAPSILLAILIIMLLTGALRFLVGLLLTTVNPFIAALYTFFFASFIGKQITRAVLTTGILAAVILLLQDLGITALSLAAGALIAYVPFLLILVVIWYTVCRI